MTIQTKNDNLVQIMKYWILNISIHKNSGYLNKLHIQIIKNIEY